MALITIPTSRVRPSFATRCSSNELTGSPRCRRSAQAGACSPLALCIRPRTFLRGKLLTHSKFYFARLSAVFLIGSVIAGGLDRHSDAAPDRSPSDARSPWGSVAKSGSQVDRVETVPITATNPFKGRQYPGEVILQAVRWYLRYPLAYEHVAELLAERGLEVDASCVWRWVQAYSPELNKRADRISSARTRATVSTRPTSRSKAKTNILIGQAGSDTCWHLPLRPILIDNG